MLSEINNLKWWLLLAMGYLCSMEQLLGRA